MDPKQDNVKVSNNFDKEVKAKEKKHHTGLKAFIIILLIVIVVPIAAAYICFFDSSKSKTIEDESFNTEEVLNQALVTSLNDVETNEAFAFSIDTGAINQTLLKKRNEVVADNPSLAEVFTGAELEAKDDIFTFKFDFNFKTIFQTRLYLETKLTYGIKEAYGNCLIFKIVSYKLGRVSGIEWLIQKIQPYIGSDEMFEEMFSSFGLSFVSNVKESEVFYPLNRFMDDVKKKFPDQDPLFYGAVSQVFNPNKEGNTLAFTEAGLQAFFSLKPYSENYLYENSNLSHDFDWKRRVNEVYRDMITAGVIGKNYTGKDSAGNKLKLHEYLYKYLVKGSSIFDEEEEYKALRDCLVAYGQAKLASKFFIDDIDNFNGYVFLDIGDPRNDPQSMHKGEGICRPVNSMSTYLANDTIETLKKAIETGVTPEYLFEIDDELLSSLLRSSKIIGYNYLLSGTTKAGTFNVSPVVVTDAYATVMDNSVLFLIEISYNDYPTYLCVGAHYKDGYYDPETYTLELEFKEYEYGYEEVNDDLKLSIFDLLDDSIEKEADMIEFVIDEETKSASMLIDCSKIIDSLGEYKPTFESMFTTGIKFVDPKDTSRGKIQVTLANK